MTKRSGMPPESLRMLICLLLATGLLLLIIFVILPKMPQTQPENVPTAEPQTPTPQPDSPHSQEKEVSNPSPAPRQFININYENAAAYVAQIPAKYVVLTFDDGPMPEYTLPILNTLRQYGMKATFFVIGARVAQHCDILQRIRQDGHEIANHTYSHPRLTQLSPEQMQRELMKTQQVIRQCLQPIDKTYQPRWFRAPYGAQNAEVVARVNRLGMNSALWSLDTQDWHIETTAEMIAEDVIQGGDRQLVLMHDGTEYNEAMRANLIVNPSRQPTADALSRILANYRANGISTLTLSEAFKD
ncbi:polysaccharide deacetylase family protein [Thermosynechococcaceae cyanobacterium Okahandja]